MPPRFWDTTAAQFGLGTHELTLADWINGIQPTGEYVPGAELWICIFAARLASVAKWRMSKGIYRFDKDLLKELADTPTLEEAPCDVLRRLPEPCIWVDTHGVDNIDGFFAFYEDNVLTVNVDVGIGILYPITIHLNNRSIGDAMLVYDETPLEGQEVYIRTKIIFATLLYLCSDSPDYGDKTPVYQPPKKTKKGWAARQSPQIWDVGVRIGATIREYLQKTGQDECASGRTLRPHIRRAHWHGYWTGPRNDPEHKKYIHKWIPAIPVNVTPADNSELPAVVRNIK